MPTDYPFVTQSKYYSPVFNAALFDGPLRLYFAQTHEAEALKLYFQIQEVLGAPELRKKFKQKSQCLYVMIYPNAETFELLFSDSEGHGFEVTQLDDSPLIGVKTPLAAGSGDKLVNVVLDLLKSPGVQRPSAEVLSL